MATDTNDDPHAPSRRMTPTRVSEREWEVTRTFDASPRRVFAAWTTPAVFRLWWVPKSSGATLQSCEQDVRAGGRYRLTFAHPDVEGTMAFFGTYLEVVTDARLVWTNEESAEGPVTTVTFDARAGKTSLTMRERHPSAAALDGEIDGMCATLGETFAQLDDLLAGRAGDVLPA